MVRPRADNWPSHLLEAEEQKTTRPPTRQRWVDRVHRDLDMLGILNSEELVTDRDRWREVVDAAKDLKVENRHEATGQKEPGDQKMAEMMNGVDVA
ncbi:Hypothetical protein CINCED_3A016384 [Cinara cedri]|uniref:Uncharacterized protein n=1 Tax=Cinara cedri TaxID=506608 RepID=A0A5E4N5T1_9HEMI|nr:Hypothetical protein CINCED_3A016384 [Cinara cedri]